MQPITKDNCDFPTLRQSGCIYVDKTAWLHRLAMDPQASFSSWRGLGASANR